jgi:hypothetical protein
LKELQGAEVSPALISSLTDAVMDEANPWQPAAWMRCNGALSRTASTSHPKCRVMRTVQSAPFCDHKLFSQKLHK